MSSAADINAAARAHAEKLKDPAYDPTEDPNYIRTEFRFIGDTKASTIAAEYKQGKASSLVYDVELDEAGMNCRAVCMTLMNPMSCSYCNKKVLKKYSFHRIYDDHVESNMASSCCCWVIDNTSVFYLDRDWANDFEQAGLCSPLCTHCGGGWDCFGMLGATAIGWGATNGVCCPGGRRIPSPPIPCGQYGGPFLYGFCPMGNAQYVFFPHVSKDKIAEFVDKLKAQRATVKAAHNIELGKAGVAKPQEGEQYRE